MKKGFTLVELSIVLVILGLLVGGILAGQSLISAARMRQGIAQLNEYKVTVAAFRDKYMALPGDIPNATNFFTAGAQPQAVTNGNGNGRIEAPSPGNLNGWEQLEMYYVFDHLAAAGLVIHQQYDEASINGASPTPESGVGYPIAKFEANGAARVNDASVIRSSDRPGILIGYQYKIGFIKEQHVMQVGICRLRVWGGGYVGGECGINPLEAFQIDTKMDDGQPSTGSVINYPPWFYASPSNGFNTLSLCSTMTYDGNGETVDPGAYALALGENRGCVIEVSLGI